MEQDITKSFQVCNASMGWHVGQVEDRPEYARPYIRMPYGLDNVLTFFNLKIRNLLVKHHIDKFELSSGYCENSCKNENAIQNDYSNDSLSANYNDEQLEQKYLDIQCDAGCFKEFSKDFTNELKKIICKLQKYLRENHVDCYSMEYKYTYDRPVDHGGYYFGAPEHMYHIYFSDNRICRPHKKYTYFGPADSDMEKEYEFYYKEEFNYEQYYIANR